MSFSSSYLEKRKKRLKEREKQLDNKFNNDIAPVGGNKDSWFKGGALSDGYEFGDITKTILGTSVDAGIGIVKGAGRMVEGLVDAATYGVAGVADLFGADSFAEDARDVAKFSATDEFTAPVTDYVDKFSILGNKADAVSEGLGQVGTILLTGGAAGAAGLGSTGVTAVTTGVTGLSSMGSGMSQAYTEGATDEEALTYGVIAGVAEAGTELLFGGLGKAVGAVGLSKGISSLDDALAKKVSSKIANQTMKNFAEFGIKAGAEGTEEVISGILQAFGKKATYMSEEDLGKLLKDEKLLDSFIVGTITSGITQSGIVPGMKRGSLIEANKQGADFITGHTETEQKVIDKVIESSVTEREKELGRKLNAKERAEIEEDVETKLIKGGISIDTIEETLGGDSYKAYKEATEKQEALKKELNELRNMKKGEMTDIQTDRLTELKAMDLEDTSKVDELKAKVSQDVFELIKADRKGQGSILAESYNERERRGVAFEVDTNKVDSKKADTYKRAMEAGVLNNTNATHDFVDLVATLEAEKGVKIDFSNNEKLKASGFAVDGAEINGVKTNGGIILNANSRKNLNVVVGHEITHILEGTELYTALKDTIISYAKSKGDYDARYKATSKLYEKVKDADIDGEITADLVGEYLFTDEKFIKSLTTNKNLFKKVYDEIKYLVKAATAGSAEKKQLLKVQRAFEKAFETSKTEKKATKNTTKNSGAKYSLSDANYLKAVESGDMETAQKMVDEAAKEAGYTVKAYHGTSRADRVGTVFRPDRATSGPMAFFTDNETIASNYAKDKKDTSIAYDNEYSDYYTQFRINRNGKNISVPELWNYLSATERNAIKEKAKHITFDDESENIIYDVNAKYGVGAFDDYTLNENKGNALKALVQTWLEDGNLYGEEQRFLDVLKFIGLENVEYRDPDARHEKVYNTWLKIQRPFDTDNANQSFYDNLSKWIDSKDMTVYERETANADLWDKNSQTPESWLDKLSRDIENGTTHAWTVIPDYVTDYLKEQRFDGIKDKGGKNGGDGHTVWIPFSSEQVKSADPVTYDDNGEVIPLSERFNSSNNDIRYSLSDIAPEDGTSERDSYAPTFYSYMGKVINNIKLDKMGAGGVVPYLKGKGVKDEEIKWSGIEAFLEGKKSVTKAELQEFTAGSELQIEETYITADALNKFSDYMYDTIGERIEDWYDDLNRISYRNFAETLGEYLSAGYISEDVGNDLLEKFEEFGSEEKPRWSQYKLEGGTNYRELVFKMPGSTYSNSAMRAHWGDDVEGVLAHARVQDFNVDEKKMLFVEEIQSDWHNEGAKEGYSDEGKAKALENKLVELKRRKSADRKDVIERLSNHMKGRVDNPEGAAKSFIDFALSNNDLYVKYLQKYDIPIDLVLQMNKLRNSQEEVHRLTAAVYEAENGIPDAPFRNNYHEYVLKRLIRMAAEEGYDSIGWTTADIQSQRWSNEYAEGYRIEYDQGIPKFLRKYGKRWGATVGKTTIPFLTPKTVVYDVNRQEEYVSVKAWKALVKSELRIQGMPKEDLSNLAFQESENGDFIIAFNTATGIEYDRAEIRKTSDSVWSMDITESMKDSVLYEGQVMYSLSENTPEDGIDANKKAGQSGESDTIPDSNSIAPVPKNVKGNAKVSLLDNDDIAPVDNIVDNVDYAKKYSDIEEQIKANEEKLESLMAEYEKIANMVDSGEMSKSDFDFRAEDITKEYDDTKRRIDSLTYELTVIEENNVTVTDAIKNYSKKDALAVVERMGTYELTKSARKKLADDLWEGMNKNTTVEQREAFAKEFAKTATETIVEKSRAENPNYNSAKEQLPYIASGIGRLTFTADDMAELKYKYDKDLKKFLGRWGYKGGTYADGTPKRKYPMSQFVIDYARETAGMSHLEDMHHADAMVEINELYEELSAEVKNRWVNSYEQATKEEIEFLKADIESTVLKAFETEGRDARVKKGLEAAYDKIDKQFEADKASLDKAFEKGKEDALTMNEKDRSNYIANLEERYAMRLAELTEQVKREKELAKKESERVRRKDLHNSIIGAIKTEYATRGLDFDEVLDKAKRKGNFASVDNTPQRFIEKTLGYKEGQILNDLTVNKIALNESAGIKWLNGQVDNIRKLSEKYNIKPGSKESAAAQMYGEGFYVNKEGEYVKYGDAELAKDFPSIEVQNKIKALAKNSEVRRMYDETLDAINASRVRNGYPEIPKRADYFLHFRAMDDTFSRLGIPFNPNDIKAKDLPTDINGMTANLKPGQPYFASANRRMGINTTYDLLGGIERYMNSAKNQIYHIDDIQTLRAVRNYVADRYGQANGLNDLDSMTPDEQEARIKDVYDGHLSTFAKFLNEEANIIAGKTSLMDRSVEGIFGRRAMQVLNTINSQVGKNMVGFNISSAGTNFLPLVQAAAKLRKSDMIKAFSQTISNKFNSDGFVENDPALIRRKGADKFSKTAWEKASDIGYILMSAVDNLTSEVIVRAKYNELTRNGLDNEQAHIKAGEWALRLMGDRSLGQMPQLFNSKTLGIFTKFQLEVRNQLDSMFYDSFQEAKENTENIEDAKERNVKTASKVASTLAQLFVFQHIFGMVYEQIAGYNPTFDILSTLATLFGWDDEEESEDTFGDNLQQAFNELLEDLPYTSTFTGGRIPMSAALPIEQLLTGKDEWGNEVSQLETLAEIAPYYLLPTGYGQFKKTRDGLRMFSNEHPIAGSYTDSGNLRFPVEETPLNIAQAAVFGQYANKNAREYFDNEYAPLTPNQVEEFMATGMSYSEYSKKKKAKKIKEAKAKELIYSLIGGEDLYQEYTDALSEIKAGVYVDRKTRVLGYLNSLDIDYVTKLILYKKQFPNDKRFNVALVNYLNERDDISYSEMEAILTELGFQVDEDGNIKW